MALTKVAKYKSLALFCRKGCSVPGIPNTKSSYKLCLHLEDPEKYSDDLIFLLKYWLVFQETTLCIAVIFLTLIGRASMMILCSRMQRAPLLWTTMFLLLMKPEIFNTYWIILIHYSNLIPYLIQYLSVCIKHVSIIWYHHRKINWVQYKPWLRNRDA